MKMDSGYALEAMGMRAAGIETGPMVLLGRLGEAALVIARDRLNPTSRSSACSPASSMFFGDVAFFGGRGAPYALTPTDI